ncbi:MULTISPECIES: hypothetical protein [unclassified Haloarcula]|nr:MULTISPECIES: hypothetical protein [Haloarcula]
MTRRNRRWSGVPAKKSFALYHVEEETRPEGGTKARWLFLGEVYPDRE